MRIIKFRGKRPDGSWNYGRSIRFKQNGEVYIQGALVEPQTVGQFTGLYDFNSTDIFEGDILLEVGTEILVQVVYEAPEFCFKDNGHGYKFLNHTEYFEVVGNIHDNPELLK